MSKQETIKLSAPLICGADKWQNGSAMAFIKNQLRERHYNKGNNVIFRSNYE